MSQALYDIAALRFWNAEEIEFRERSISSIAALVQRKLTEANRAWRFERIEGPTLTPRLFVSDAYGDDDIYVTNAKAFTRDIVMRPETTASSYQYARFLMNKGKINRPPLCVWQAGKSYRREENDGASFPKLRLNEFWQLEFQCIYPLGTLNDYRAAVQDTLGAHLAFLVGGKEWRIVPSDRLPGYSARTEDVEILRSNGKWTEVCSISTRTDFDADHLVIEIAVGLDRLVAIGGEL